MKHKLLVVDDDQLTRETLAAAFVDSYSVTVAASGEEALEILARQPIDLVISDMMMPGLNGLSLLGKINTRENPPALVFVTGHATIDSAVEAIKLGAHDYVTKPVNLDRLALVLSKALETRMLRSENRRLKADLKSVKQQQQLIGHHPTMRRIINLADQVASTNASVLIYGETGTGKELIASRIHEKSARAQGPFTKINCSAFAESLLESELFGHERGAFTGALNMRKGHFELAHGGTLFLDEIGDLPKSAQTKLLRFLQERVFERVGGNTPIEVDVRVISATHKDLAGLVKHNEFREDLYYRLRVVPLEIPPLRARGEDIELLIHHFLNHFERIHERAIEHVSSEAVRLLTTYDWPGNVRELMNCIESMVVMAMGPRLEVEDVPADLRAALGEQASDEAGTGVLEDMERQAIMDALQKSGGNRREAARQLGIALRTLYRRLDKWGS